MEGEKEEIKSVAEVMNEELSVPKSLFMKMVKVFHKQSYDTEVAKNEEFQTIYETIIK